MCCIVFVSVCVYVYMQSQNVYDDTNSVFPVLLMWLGAFVYTRNWIFICVDASVLWFFVCFTFGVRIHVILFFSK